MAYLQNLPSTGKRQELVLITCCKIEEQNDGKTGARKPRNYNIKIIK